MNIGDGVTGIGDTAFFGCSYLVSVSIGTDVVSIGDWAFFGCDRLSEILVADGNPAFSSADGVLFNKEQTTVVQCPAGKEGSYTIPSSVTAVGARAFFGCGKLNYVTIGNRVSTIGDFAFSNCQGLEQIEFLGDAPEFVGSNSLETGGDVVIAYHKGTAGWTDVENWSDSRLTELPELTYAVIVAETIENGMVSADPISGVVDTLVTVTAAPEDGYELVEIMVNGVAIEGNAFRIIAGNNVVSAVFKLIPCAHPDSKTVVLQVVAATCTESGLTEGKVCECGEVITAQTMVPALGHDLTDVEGKLPTATEPGYSAYKDCSRCDYTEGYTVIPAGEVLHDACNLGLKGQIEIVYWAQFRGFEGIDFTEKAGLLVWESAVSEENATIETADQNHPTMKKLTTTYNGLKEYEQVTDGIPAKEYGKTLYLRAYLEVADGMYVYGPLKEYGVYKYCQNKLGSAKTKDTLKKVCSEILHYGAAAQQQFNYNTNALVNNGILVPEILDAGAWDANYLDMPLEVPETTIIQTEGVKRTAANLALEGAIVMRFNFMAPAGGFAKAEMLVWDSDTVAPLTEENVSYRVDTYEEDKDYPGEWYFDTQGTPAKEYGKTVFVCAKFTDAEGNVSYSDVTSYSPEYYAYRQINKYENNSKYANLVNLCKRMVIYGEAARVYFGG